MRKLKVALAALVIAYVALAGALYSAMRQPPASFGKFMSYLPMPLMAVLPLRPLWTMAREGKLQVGDAAPDFDLPATNGESRIRLSDFRDERPVVLIFGSYTCPPFRKQAPELNRVYAQYKDRVEFYLIYIQEAHPSNLWQLPANEKEDVVFADPTNIEERSNVANACIRRLDIAIPTLLDGLDNATETAYTGWPDRIYVIDREGTVRYKSRPGPFGFKIDEMEPMLRQLADG